MSAPAKQRLTLSDLSEPQQLRELNRQMEWVWNQLMGGLTRKALSPGLNNVIESKAEREDVNELTGVVTQHSTLIEQNADAIMLKADSSETNALGARMSQAEAALSIQADEIAAKVSQAAFNDLGARVQSAESSITQQADQIATKVSQTVFNDLDGRVSSAESSITQQAGQIATKVSQTTFNALENRVSSAESSITQTPTQITAAVRELDVGGPNLMRRTMDFSGDDWIRLGSWSEWANKHNGCTVMRKNTAWNCPTQQIAVTAGETYTYSAWLSCDTDGAVGVAGRMYRDTTAGHCETEESYTVVTYNLAYQWKRYSFTVHVTGSGIAEPCFDAVQDGTYWYVCGIKLERGNKATDWAPHAEEFFAGSVVQMDREKVYIGTPEFEVDVPGNEAFHLDGEGGSMDNLTVGRLIAPNVAEKYTGPAAVTVGAGGAYGTFSALAAILNDHMLTDTLTVNVVSDLYETVSLKGLSGGVTLAVNGGNHTLYGGMELYSNSVLLDIKNLKVVGGVRQVSGGYALWRDCTMNAAGGDAAVELDRGARGLFYDCALYNATNLFNLSWTSTMGAYNARGGNCTNFLAARQSTVFMEGTRPDGGVSAGACLMTPADPSTLPIDYGEAQPSATPVTTAVVTANASGTWNGSGWMSGENGMRQGVYRTTAYAGGMWFDSTPLTGKTVRSASLRLTRRAGVGRSGPVTLTLYGISTAGKNGNPRNGAVNYGVIGAIGNGETAEFALPTAAAQALADGTATGFMLDAGSESLLSSRLYSAGYALIEGADADTPPALTAAWQ